MFKNRISVISRARKGANSYSFPPSSVGCNGSGNGDHPSPSLIAPFASSNVQRSVPPAAVDEIGAMEAPDPVDEGGVCADEGFFAIEDSGEIRENELMLDDEDDNDVTKDLDFTSNRSPSLFSVASSTPAARLTATEREQIIGDVFTPNVAREFGEVGAQRSDSIERSTNGTSGDLPISAPVFRVPQVPQTPYSANGWVVAETPQTVAQLPGQSGMGSASTAADNDRRRCIASFVRELLGMSFELAQRIKSFEDKYLVDK